MQENEGGLEEDFQRNWQLMNTNIWMGMLSHGVAAGERWGRVKKVHWEGTVDELPIWE